MVLVTIAFVLIVLWARAFYGAMETYARGEKLLEEGQTIRAITYFDRALHWYAPLNPYVEKATLKLWEIGEKAEKAGDTRMALIAFESIRSGMTCSYTRFNLVKVAHLAAIVPFSLSGQP